MRTEFTCAGSYVYRGGEIRGGVFTGYPAFLWRRAREDGGGWAIGSGKHSNRQVINCDNGDADVYFSSSGGEACSQRPDNCVSWFEKDCDATAGSRRCKMFANPTVRVAVYYGHR